LCRGGALLLGNSDNCWALHLLLLLLLLLLISLLIFLLQPNAAFGVARIHEH
jgi:hypothetical protein